MTSCSHDRTRGASQRLIHPIEPQASRQRILHPRNLKTSRLRQPTLRGSSRNPIAERRLTKPRTGRRVNHPKHARVITRRQHLDLSTRIRLRQPPITMITKNLIVRRGYPRQRGMQTHSPQPPPAITTHNAPLEHLALRTTAPPAESLAVSPLQGHPLLAPPVPPGFQMWEQPPPSSSVV